MHPKVNHINGKQRSFITTNYALNVKFMQMKKLMNGRFSPII
jgi:hypothetical protein